MLEAVILAALWSELQGAKDSRGTSWEVAVIIQVSNDGLVIAMHTVRSGQIEDFS